MIRKAFAASILAGVLTIALFLIAPSFFWRDDFQSQYLPGSAEVGRAWRSGEVPLLSTSSWFGGALASEYQFGVFSVVRGVLDLIVWALPLSLPARAAFLFLVHAMIAAAGAYLLARDYGIRHSYAMLVALIATLNGAQLWWATTWFPTMASFAWLPWYWLALRGVMAGRRWSWAGAAFSLYLLITAGWPYGVLMAVVVAAMNGMVAIAGRRWRALSIMTGASLLGLGLAMPAVAMLLDYFRVTARQSVAGLIDQRWIVPPAALFGLVLPVFSASWTLWEGAVPHAAVELLGGLIPLAAIATIIARSRFWRERWAETLMLIGLLALMLAPGVGAFRWSFRWLPLFHFALALVGALALETSDTRRASRWTLILIAVASGAAFAFDANLRETLMFAATLAAFCAIWYLIERRRPVAYAPVAITILSIVMTFVLQWSRGEVPVWHVDESMRSAAPFDASRRYLGLYETRDVFGKAEGGRVTTGINAGVRLGNMPMLAGLHYINGYTPLGPAALHNILSLDVHGCVAPLFGRWLIHHHAGPQGLLHHLGVDGLIVPNRIVAVDAQTLANNGWVASGAVENHTIYHRRTPFPAPVFAASGALVVPNPEAVYSILENRRSGALPVLLLGKPEHRRYGFRELTGARELRTSSEVVVRGTSGPALVVFRRPWLPGWRATLDGKPLPVIRADLVMPAVEIPNGAEGKLRIVYRPASLIIGGCVALASLAVIAAVSLWLRLKT